MTTMYSRYSQPELPFQKHSDTSISAAFEAEPAAGTQKTRILEYLRKYRDSGATDEDMQLYLGMNPSTQRPRRIELVQQGLVRDSGTTRPTRAGRQATVWMAR